MDKKEKMQPVELPGIALIIKSRRLEARVFALEQMLREWIKPCFCDQRGTCLMCQTRTLLDQK